MVWVWPCGVGGGLARDHARCAKHGKHGLGDTYATPANTSVISARQGEFEAGFDGQGQTREHTTLAKTLGINQLVIVVNKMDEQSVEWSQERYSAIQKKFTPFLKSVGYNPKTDISWVPVSGYTGANIKKPAGDACPWYT